MNDYGPGVVSDLKFVDVNAKTAATHTLIAGLANHRIRIISMFARSLSSTANNVYFKEEDGTATFLGTNSTDVEAFDASGISGKAGWVVPPGQWKETTTPGKGVQAVLSGATSMAFVGSYVYFKD